MENEQIRQIVRDRYGKIAREGLGGCGCSSSNSCCGESAGQASRNISRRIGYTEEDFQAVPEGANLGLGCGNPIALASLREGETVLDLGSGAGFDCFLAAKQVGITGRVIGVDMTPGMLTLARANLDTGDYPNVEFRLGEIEHLPVADNSVDVIISNCVINLSVDKPGVFREAFRVLRPGGRLMVSDIVLSGVLPPEILDSIDAYASCVSGAAQKGEYLNAIENAGFTGVEIIKEDFFSTDYLIESSKQSPFNIVPRAAVEAAANAVSSVKVIAIKPG